MITFQPAICSVCMHGCKSMLQAYCRCSRWIHGGTSMFEITIPFLCKPAPLGVQGPFCEEAYSRFYPYCLLLHCMASCTVVP